MDIDNICKLSVDELSNQLHHYITYKYNSTIDVLGEIAEYRYPKKHAYFSLIGTGTQLRCCVWKSKLHRIIDHLENGIEVIVRGRLDFYRTRNECSFIVDNVYRLDKGLLSEEYNKTLEYCTKHGYITDVPKLLPRIISNIVILTSSTGAAIRDIIAVFQSKSIGVNIYIFNIDVQGSQCIKDCISGLNSIRQFMEYIQIDVVFLTRGGGSDSDLAWFNDLDICKAIYGWKTETDIPIISAIGHEKDSVIVDKIVDYHLGTPSIGADYIIQNSNLNKIKVLSGLESSEERLRQCIRIIKNQYTHRMILLKQRIESAMQDLLHKIDEIQNKITYIKKTIISNYMNRMRLISRACNITNIQLKYKEYTKKIVKLENRTTRLKSKMIERSLQRLNQIANTNSISKTLEQGFILPMTNQGKCIKKIDQYINKKIKLYTGKGYLNVRLVEIVE